MHSQEEINQAKRYQFISWFPEWHGFHFVRLDKKKTDLAYIYDWCLYIAFWEIRKWHKFKEGEFEIYNKGNQ